MINPKINITLLISSSSPTSNPSNPSRSHKSSSLIPSISTRRTLSNTCSRFRYPFILWLRKNTTVPSIKMSHKIWEKFSSTGSSMYTLPSNSSNKPSIWPSTTSKISSPNPPPSQKKTINWLESPVSGSPASTKKYTLQKCQTTPKSPQTHILWDKWEEWSKKFSKNSNST